MGKTPKNTLALPTADCEVFLFETIYNGYECAGCTIDEERSHRHLAGARDLMEHVIAHRRAGHRIPDSLVTKTIRERENEMLREARFKNIRDTEAAIIQAKQDGLHRRSRPNMTPQYGGLDHKDLMRS